MDKKQKQKKLKKLSAIFLLAGFGKRISDVTNNPKCLLKINKKTLIDRNLDILKKLGISNVIFVLGYKKQMIKKQIKEFEKFFNFKFTFNNDYRSKGNTFSLLKGLEKSYGNTLVFDGDLIFSSRILKSFLKNNENSSFLIGKTPITNIECAKALADKKITGIALEEVRDAINAKEDSGVSASIIFDGENYRLALNSTQTGEDASISGITLGAAFGGQLESEFTQAGQDAVLNVNGVAITSPSNQVEGAIQGVTLNLQAEGDSTVKVEQDTRAVREAITGFVDAYNDLKGTIGELTSFNAETGAAGELLGDSAVRTVESRLRSVLGGGIEGQFSMLTDIGISLQRDGTPEIDSGKLDDAIANDQDALSAFFAGAADNEGMAGQVNQTIEQLLGSNGTVSGAISGAETRIESLGERYTRMEQSIEQTISRYRTQFGQLDSMIAQMNQTSSYLTQQFDALDAQLGRD